MKRAILSVSDKTGLVAFARCISEQGYELVSTGGTLRVLSEAGLSVTPVSAATDFPEIFGGRVKTLHPKVHGGILFRRDHQGDLETLKELNIEAVDLVVVNLYPFRDTISAPGIAVDDAVEQIDIGGPTLLRAAAKNFKHVAVVVDPTDYEAVGEELAAGDGLLSAARRAGLARKAFEHTASYDAAISGYFREQVAPSDDLPVRSCVAFERGQVLRYGENPHQSAMLYGSDTVPKLGGGRCLQGKALSYNNLVDSDGAIATVAEFDMPAVVIVKHTNPCGVGWSLNGISHAYEEALLGDPQSAFGGIVAMNRPCDADTAARIVERFFEVVVAPSFETGVLEILASKKNLRVLELDPKSVQTRQQTAFRWTSLGVLAQALDGPVTDADCATWTVATETGVDQQTQRGLEFLWRVCKHVKSNAIVVGRASRTFGIGAGQMSRVDAVKIALEKAQSNSNRGLLLASDAFFPFRDNIDVAAAGGVSAIVQPGGSRRDSEVIDACNEHGIAMVLTGRRHFKH